MSAIEVLSREFATLPEVLLEQAIELGAKTAVVDPSGGALSYSDLGARMSRAASALQRDGVGVGEAVAICASSSNSYVAAFFGALGAGAVAAPLAPSSTADSLVMMLNDCGAKVFFLDAGVAKQLEGVADQISAKRVALDGSSAGVAFEEWLAPKGSKPTPVTIDPDQGFNIIYSSGTTGAPKGIVQPHRMRWGQIRHGVYPADSVTLISTPLYSNTTLVSFLPTLTNGGTVVLMAKFDAEQFLKLSEKHRVTHAMLVPVQYRRLMERADFDGYDLSSYRVKFSTSAPFPAEIKAEVLKRWPGGLVEFYGMTEGGGSCMLLAHEHPDKLTTVGRAMPGHDIRLIDEDGKEVAQGEIGEVVGRSGAMMVGYHNQPGKTSEAEWCSPEGLRFIRTGDVGRFDEDGFLTLMDRKKDMIISGGFNIYPSDLEAEIVLHEAVLEAAVVGVLSDKWGETPVAFVALKPGQTIAPDALKEWVNAKLGKTQRLADLQLVDQLPRSHIGKVLKRELRDAYAPAVSVG
ncbi:class I adenylate-forming enzyme family protein [Phenylobacterium sp.]|uniref:class I adenylate-forming enzyme family protein n=1 Tax=Phenylobacterium sp. TaxID=1871053 RepID=UPI00273676BC|nr:class I adenylate-forming enzyme family protein [Phenylobacterium sp.]MDP3595327.1 class I adenylate-forming enzyme family protein [Phenylobacterium sp.]